MDLFGFSVFLFVFIYTLLLMFFCYTLFVWFYFQHFSMHISKNKLFAPISVIFNKNNNNKYCCVVLIIILLYIDK